MSLSSDGIDKSLASSMNEGEYINTFLNSVITDTCDANLVSSHTMFMPGVG